MKVVILAGGFGTRLSEETKTMPKPMVEIGGKPIIWHIMKHYSKYGHNEFIVCLGYKGYVIKEWFSNYFLHNSDVTFDLSKNEMEVHNNNSEPWKVTLIDTGLSTMTGSRIKKVSSHIGNEPFMLTYGDGVGDVDLDKLIDFHNKSKKLLTVTSTQPEGRFGKLIMNSNDEVLAFAEKVDNKDLWINSGFFVCEPEVLDYIENNRTDVVFEKQPLENIASDNNMIAFKHYGFWRPMDTLRDKITLEELWNSGSAPWKTWE